MFSFIQVHSQEKPIQSESNQPNTFFEIHKNSVSLETNFIATLNFQYGRLLPLKNHFGILLGGGYALGVGFGEGSHWLNAEALAAFGGPKHIFETGLVTFLGTENSGPGAKIGYRFQHQKGLLIKVNLYVITFEDPPVFPMIGVGYSF
jgi:hypothetical protein